MFVVSLSLVHTHGLLPVFIEALSLGHCFREREKNIYENCELIDVRVVSEWRAKVFTTMEFHLYAKQRQETDWTKKKKNEKMADQHRSTWCD